MTSRTRMIIARDFLLILIGALAIIAIASLFIAWAVPADAQDRGAWFKSLMRPDVGTSCCDTSDCRRAVDADWREGQWWTRLAGQMTPIPDAKVLRDPPTIDGEAYVCAAPDRTVYCFIPPSPGS